MRFKNWPKESSLLPQSKWSRRTPIRGINCCFELPLTHRLQHHGGLANEGLEFLISVAGFLLGYRLVPEGHGYLQRAPLDRAHSSDLSHVSAREMAVCLTSADRTWAALGTEQQRGLRATINGYQFAVAYTPRPKMT